MRAAGRMARMRMGRWWIVAFGAVLLLAAYVHAYRDDPFRPGHDVIDPRGWLGFYDQSVYQRSAMAFAHGRLDASAHYYPLPYALAASPFERVMKRDAFAVLDGAALLVSYAAFVVFAGAAGVVPVLAAASFVAPVVIVDRLMRIWTLPWTTSLSCALIWSLLAVTATWMRRGGGSGWGLGVAGGALAALVALTRPADAVPLAGGALAVTGWAVAGRGRAWSGWRGARGLWPWVVGGVAVMLPYAALYVRIYGLAPTDYMVHSAQVGFRFGTLPFKLFTLLVEPRPWFADGVGLVERFPWLMLGVAGMLYVPAAATGRRAVLGLLSLALVAYVAMMCAYVDLLPSGLWLYGNVHYFKWVFPGLTLLGVVLARDLVVGIGGRRARGWALASIAGAVVLTGWRPVPVAVGAGDARVRMAHYAMAAPDWGDTYFGPLAIRDRGGVLANITGVRALPDPAGMRVIALGRAMVEPLGWASTGKVAGVPAMPDGQWEARWRFGWPCWLPPHACRRLRGGL